jgi:hypothetical protein
MVKMVGLLLLDAGAWKWNLEFYVERPLYKSNLKITRAIDETVSYGKAKMLDIEGTLSTLHVT